LDTLKRCGARRKEFARRRVALKLIRDLRRTKRRRWRWRAAGIVGSILALNWYLVAATDVIRPRERTEAAMAALEQRVRLAAASKLEIPDNLNDLPLVAGKVSDANDAWGRPLVLDRTGDVVTLISYGKDGRPGGTGLSADLLHRFTIQH
jgi:hypothetical protein